MFKQKILTVLSMAVVLALLAAAVMPFAALADDVAPPPTAEPVVDAAPTEEPVVEVAPTDVPVVGVAPTDAPVVDAAPTAEPVVEVAPTDVPVVDAAPTEEPVVEVASTDTPVVDAAPTDVPVADVPPTESVSDVVAAMADANAVLVDADGNPIPMASQEAAEVLSTGDPSGTLDNTVAAGYGLTPGATFSYFPSDGTNLDGNCVTAGNSVTCYWDAPLQTAVNDAAAGSTVNVEAGIYIEQIVINKSLTLVGAGESTTTILAPTIRTGTVTQGTTIHDYLLAAYAPSGTTIDVRVEGFTLDINGMNKTVGTARLDGVFFRDVNDTGGTMAGLFSSTIHNFAATPDYESWGVAVYGDSELTLNLNDIHNYTRDGILVVGDGGAGPDPNVTISDNIVTGSATSLNGINIQDVTAGDVTGNTVTGNTRSDPWAGGGIVLWTSTGVPITGNHVNGNFYGINLQDGTDGITVSGNDLTNNIKRGITLDASDNNTVSGNTITGPVGGTDDVGIGVVNTSTGNMIGGTTLAAGNTINMATSGSANLYAIHMQADAGADNTIRYNTIIGGQRAVQFDGPPGITGLTTVSNNVFSDQAFGGIVAYNNGDLVITNNTLTNAVRPIEFFGPVNVTVTGNTINGSTYGGINAGSASGTTNISQNHIYNCGLSGSTYTQDGIALQSGADNVIMDYNEIDHCRNGINIQSGSTGNQITNNNIHNNDFSGITVYEALTTVTGNTIDNSWRGIETSNSLTAHNNIFTNNSYGSIIFHNNFARDVTNNWWGNAAGPGAYLSGVNLNTYNQANQVEYIQANANSNFTFAPWLNAAPPTGVSFAPVTTSDGGSYASIQAGVNGVTTGGNIFVAAGTYAENVNVNKIVTLDGAGSESDPAANTIISGSGSGIGLALSAGSDASHRVIVKDVRVTGFQTGVVVNSYNTLNNVASVSNTLYGVNLSPLQDLLITGSKFNNNNTGLKIASTASVDNLTITNSEFNANTNIGWYSDKGSSSGSNITNLNISYTTFNDNLNKGFYTEKLSNAVFDHITINNSGTGGALNHRAGMDLNLKYGSYTNIQILNSTISNSGTGDPNGGGLLIKARSTGSYASLPATLNNVALSNLTVTGNGGGTYAAGIRIGESNNSFTGIDAGPTGVVISNSVFSGNTAHAVRNATAATIVLAENNFWNSASGPSGVGLGSGDAVSNGVDYTPWLTVPVGQTDTDGDGIQDATDTTPNGDTDGDGVDYAVDNCPTVANADQADTDGDGLGNTCDTTPNGDPTPDDGTTTISGTTLSPILIPVTGGEQVALNTTAPTTLQLPGGNQVLIDSGVGTSASVSEEEETSLPASVPSGNTFVGAMTVNVMDGGTTVSTLPAGATMEVSFVIPSSFDAGQTFSILYWNPALNGGLGDWETVPATVTSDGHVVATVNFTGTFVLVVTP